MNRTPQNKRGGIGRQYQPHRITNVAKVHPTKRRADNIDYFGGDDMDGGSIMDMARDLLEKGKSAANTAQNIYTSEVGTALRNLIPDSDDTARDGFAGERHAILKLANGKQGVANYMGPDTQVIKRLNRGDPGRTAVDEVSKAHDIRYALAKNLGDVRNADNIMIKAVKGIEQRRGDAPRNILLAKAITAKKFAEDIGVLKKDAFSGALNKNMSDSDRNTLMSNLGGLAQKGYGLNLPGGALLPGDMLKQKLLGEFKKNKNKNKKSIMTNPTGSGTSMSKTFAGMSGYKMIGSGDLPFVKYKSNQKAPIMNLITKQVIPLLMKSVGIPEGVMPTATITNRISSAIDSAKSGNLSTIVANLTKTILPMLTAAKVKSMGMRMSGKGITDILGDAKNTLLKGLGKIIFSAFKSMIEAGKPKMSGQGMCGKGFWGDFAKGFKSVFKPFATIAGPVLDAVGMPEFGIPLSTIGAVL